MSANRRQWVTASATAAPLAATTVFSAPAATSAAVLTAGE
jgi:hypothetical protein